MLNGKSDIFHEKHKLWCQIFIEDLLNLNLHASMKDIEMVTCCIKISILVTSVQRNKNGKFLAGVCCTHVKRNVRTSKKVLCGSMKTMQ